MELNDVFKVCFRTSTKFVQWLQHNILHKILPVNHYLQKIKVTEIETCTFCERECETILRVLFMWTKLSGEYLEWSKPTYLFHYFEASGL